MPNNNLNTSDGALLPSNAPPADPAAATTPPAQSKPVTSISTEQGVNALQKTVQTATKLGGTPPANAQIPVNPNQTQLDARTAAAGGSGANAGANTTTQTQTTTTPSVQPTKVSLINPTTGQELNFSDANANKDSIQSYMNAGYALSSAEGTLPDWLTPTGKSASTTVTGSTTPTGNPQLDAANTALASAKSDLAAATAKLTNFNVSNDPQLQTLLSSITSSWNQRISDMTNAENSRIAALTTTGIRLGNQYTGGMGGVTGSIISAEEKNAIDQIGSLQDQKQQALSAAQSAFESQKWTQYNDLVTQANKAYEDQLAAVGKLQDAQTAQDQKLQDAQAAATRDANIAKLYAAGTTDAASILAGLQKAGDKTTTLDDINKAITALTPPGIPDLVKTASANGASPDVLQAILKAPDLNAAYAAAGNYASGGTGIVGEYNFYKAQALAAGQTPVDFNTYQTIDANRKAPAAGSGGDSVSSLAQLLVEGQLAPSELSKRSTGVGSYSDILNAANAYSMKTYGVPFNIAKADENYKFANNPTTQNTLNYLGSLIGSSDGNGGFTGGNLNELESQSQSLGRTSFPSINNVAAWARLATGNPAIAAYQATVTEVSDQIAKILQGGGSGSGSTDAKLQQASNLFNTSFSADQIKAVISSLQPLLVSRGESMIKNNPYLSDYADQFGIDQSGPGGAGGGTGSQIILNETAAQNAVINYGKANPSSQAQIKTVLGETNPATGQPYTYSDAAQILGIDVSSANSTADTAASGATGTTYTTDPGDVFDATKGGLI